MFEADKEGTIFGKMMERRSRSEELTERAHDRGLEVFEAESETAMADQDPVEETELEMKPAFEESDVALEAAVFEKAIQEESLDACEGILAEDEGEALVVAEDDGLTDALAAEEIEAEASDVEEVVAELGAEERLEDVATIPADPQVDEDEPLGEVADSEANAVAQTPCYFENMDEEDEAEEEALAGVAAEPTEPEEEAERRPEDLIDESEDLLAAEPEPITDAEVTMAAEELVDRIGPVVDIQSLPKTQPTRVLSKTAKAAELPKQDSIPEKTVSKEPVVEEKASQASEEDVPAKKKKKKISLLDSYFKGL